MATFLHDSVMIAFSAQVGEAGTVSRIRIWSLLFLDPDSSLICTDQDLALNLALDPDPSINKQKKEKP
jgi:hypothetical protein